MTLMANHAGSLIVLTLRTLLRFSRSAPLFSHSVVKVTVPENTIDDFPDPNEKIQSRGWSVYQDPQDGGEEVDISNSLFRFGDMLDPL